MTVKEIFDLRKQGKIEEAYDAIRPMYAAHKGKYTTLCMFWTAADVLKLRLQQGRTEEAEKIYEALKRMLPRIEEITKELDKQRDQKGTASSTAETKDVVAKKADENLPWENNKPQHSAHSAASFLQHAAHRLASTVPAGSPAVPPAITSSPSSPTASLACPVLSDSVAEGLNRGQQAVLAHNLHFKITELARRFFPETVLKQDTLLLYNPKECRGKKKFVFSSSLRIPDPSLLGDP